MANVTSHTSTSGNSLSAKNPYLRSQHANSMRIRSVASSTAIETGEAICDIEDKLRIFQKKGYQVGLYHA